MKHVISTLGKPIEFNLSGTRKLIIDTSVPVAVNEVEFATLETRLGHQIREVEVVTGNPKETTETTIIPETETVEPEAIIEPEIPKDY